MTTLLVYDWRCQCGDCSGNILIGTSAERCPHCGAHFDKTREVATLQYPRHEYRPSFLNVRRHRLDWADFFFGLLLLLAIFALWRLSI